jgi:hypothetical protein
MAKQEVRLPHEAKTSSQTRYAERIYEELSAIRVSDRSYLLGSELNLVDSVDQGNGSQAGSGERRHVDLLNRPQPTLGLQSRLRRQAA